MFCPRCGKAEQLSETYCRQCGLFLPDLSKGVNRELPPEDHLTANAVLSAMTIVTSFTLSILLWSFFGFRSDTHPLIYITAGLLIGIGAWHIQSLIRIQKLKKQWKRRTPLAEIEAALDDAAFKSATTAKLLNPADAADMVPARVTENTTRHLVEKPHRKSS